MFQTLAFSLDFSSAMFALRTRLTPLYARGFATAAAETKKPAADKAYKVVVIGGGPGGLSGKRRVHLCR